MQLLHNIKTIFFCLCNQHFKHLSRMQLINRALLERGLLVLLCVFAFTGTSQAVSYEEISALELNERISDKKDTGYLILDVRERTAFDLGHIPEAINIPLNELGYRYSEMDKTKDIIVYCNDGIQSRIGCQILMNVDFKDVYNLTEGLKEWNYALVADNGGISI